MARLARTIVPGYPHHVTQRGNRRLPTFFGDEDYQAYLALMAEHCAACGVAIWAWCLMPNHVHLVAVPKTAEALARALGEAHRRYTRRINFREGWRGHLWQERFFSCVLDARHALAAARYVERNPVRARLVRRAWRWPWSSAAAHVGAGQDAGGLLDLAAWSKLARGRDWRAELSRAEDEADLEELRRRTHTGRPLGSDGFLKNLEDQLGRRLRPRTVGRPRKEDK